VRRLLAGDENAGIRVGESLACRSYRKPLLGDMIIGLSILVAGLALVGTVVSDERRWCFVGVVKALSS